MATGIGFFVALAGVTYAVATPEPFQFLWLELAAAGALPAALVYGGYWLASNEFDPGELYTVARGWFVGAVAVSVVGGVAILSARPGQQVVVESVFLLVSAASAGAVLGLAFGVHTTRLTSELHTEFEAASDDRPSVETTLDDHGITDERRRLVAQALLDGTDSTVELQALAADLRTELGVRNRERAATKLHHVYLPALDEDGVIEYEADRQVVSVAR
jgi:hypothetical protein